MPTDDAKKNAIATRYDRYLPIIELLASKSHFRIKGVQVACPQERPAVVTRLVNELVEQGWLIREQNDETIRWNSSRGDFSTSKWLDEKLFGAQVKASPVSERPRERLLAHGAANLGDSELLAILVRSGRPGESAVMAGAKVAKAFDGRLERLASAGRGELKSLSLAVEKTAYCQIMAGIELGRRVAAANKDNVITRISKSQEAVLYCLKRFDRLACDSKQEEFHIVTLDTKNQVIDTHRITVGTLDASLVHPREVFRPAIKDAAASVILVHNHPSGDPTPSREDHAVTRRLEAAGELLGLEVLDHIILGAGIAVSIRDTTGR